MDNMYGLYTVYDNVAKRFGPIYEAVNDEVATRSMTMMMDKVDPRFRDEYTLYKTGTYDMLTGVIIAETLPQKVVIPSEFKQKMEVVK